jgi:tetratricopeptide (TPR) repeat protein
MSKGVARLARGLALLAVAAAAAFALHRDVYQQYRVNAEYPKLLAETLWAQAHPDSYQTSTVARATLQRARELRDASYGDIRLDLVAAMNCGILKRFDEGIAHCTDALRRDRRPEIFFTRGELEMQAGRRDRAIADFVAAAEFTPIYLDELADASVRQEVEAELSRRNEAVRRATAQRASPTR